MIEQKNLEMTNEANEKQKAFELCGMEVSSFRCTDLFQTVEDALSDIVRWSEELQNGTVSFDQVKHRIDESDAANMIGQAVVLLRLGEFMIQKHPEFLEDPEIKDELDDDLYDYADFLEKSKLYGLGLVHSSEEAIQIIKETDNG